MVVRIANTRAFEDRLAELHLRAEEEFVQLMLEWESKPCDRMFLDCVYALERHLHRGEDHSRVGHWRKALRLFGRGELEAAAIAIVDARPESLGEVWSDD